ncbi:diguanylate cyclase (GGDEF) domain-containing protein [Selenomonas ruminantium]|uniref:Diguanylate cyclase (GGDEF) domain-containing protein n=1 Tax=Selenomonas ruminantium TaxID=971 RepID=A0A1M6S3H6_SELRU|nr:diguanylate cyclase [Selenomonas ruminantium]SHK39226.1 diguanylate cyclase (GGDEF) domain-containing protein [Selenomonas ruminantium]
MNRKSIHKKLLLLLIMMGMLPLLSVLVYGGLRVTENMEDHAQETGWMNNNIISEHLTNLLQNNFYALHTLASTPTIRNYLKNPNPADEELIKQMLRNNDELFHDKNLTAVTDAKGLQLIRSDNTPRVNISQRRHFQEAISGKAFVSDMMISMSTGKMIVVLSVPIFDEKKQPIGALQRNFSLDSFDQFVKSQSENEISSIVMDRENKIIAHSSNNINAGDDVDDYKQFVRLMTEDSGMTRTELHGKEHIITYTHHPLTGWFIVTAQPCSVIYQQINREIALAGSMGILLLIIVSLIANTIASRLTTPIRKICQVITNIVKGKDDNIQLDILSEDEIGEMAMAINEIRAMRHNLKQSAEIDTLTGLNSRAAVEAECRKRLQEYEESLTPGMLAIFLIDLDNFKKASKDEGHQYGDRILQKFAQGLKELFRAYDCVGHLDGDEFVVIIDHQSDLEIIKRKASEINQMSRSIILQGDNINLTTSIGIAIAPQNGKTYNHLFHAADLALFAAKERGRNCFVIAGEDEGEFDNLKK